MQELSKVDILIPTYNRATALAVTLTSLYFQEYQNFDIYVSDQGDRIIAEDAEEIIAITRALRMKGHRIEFHRNLPRRGMAQQRQFLLDLAQSKHVLYLDDDLILETFVLRELVEGISSENCGLVGTGTIGLNYLQDERGHEQSIEFWETHVTPEKIIPHSGEWKRHVIHNAANLHHIQKNLSITPERPRKYKLAWASACVLYDREKLIESGGFEFWKKIPAEHCGEDVAAQLKVMARYGGCGIIPCGVYHQELKTTLPDRRFNIPEQLDLFDFGG